LKVFEQTDKQTDRQTDKQTNTDENTTSLAEVIKVDRPQPKQ